MNSWQNLLDETVRGITPPDGEAAAQAKRRLDSLTKPPGSLGKLEEIACQLAGITGTAIPALERKAVVVMAADHGVCAEGVSAYPQEVTRQMVRNFLQGGAAVNVLARQTKAQVFCVDIGVKDDVDGADLIIRKVRRGTDNMTKGPAMSRNEALEAVCRGIEVAETLAEQGYALLATGEMGIGNTTASSAILAAMTGAKAEDVVGRGTGVNDQQWEKKRLAVVRAIEVNKPDPQDPLDVLHKVGGLEIAGLAGLILGAAKQRVPVVIDGFISTAAAMIAGKLSPLAVQFMFASHLSQEPGHRLMLQRLGLEPVIHMDLRLGEGTGAVLCFPFFDAIVRIMREMATFASAGISSKQLS
jgi:nicotinate-nucleotide--dimethylbenzimidazole phosphoribosyltransferase